MTLRLWGKKEHKTATVLLTLYEFINVKYIQYIIFYTF